jgi:hypothetical protein
MDLIRGEIEIINEEGDKFLQHGYGNSIILNEEFDGD